MPRAFIASPIAARYWLELQTIQHQLQIAGLQYRLIRPSHFHLTVAFIGEVEDDILRGLNQKMQEILESFKPVEVTGFSITGFPELKRTRAVVLKVGGKNTTRLQRQASKVREWLQKIAVPFDSQPFVPHITLGRTERGEDFTNRLPAKIDSISLKFEELNLYISSFSDDKKVEFRTADSYLQSRIKK